MGDAHLREHDERIGKDRPVALIACRQKQRASRGGLTDADGMYRRRDVLHLEVEETRARKKSVRWHARCGGALRLRGSKSARGEI